MKTLDPIPLTAGNAQEAGTETTISPMVVFVSKPPSDPTSLQRMKAMEESGALDFWNRPEEDIYTLEDGEPV